MSFLRSHRFAVSDFLKVYYSLAVLNEEDEVTKGQ